MNGPEAAHVMREELRFKGVIQGTTTNTNTNTDTFT